ncbi:MAG: type VI secretion system tip protein VgrG [Deltaproteobacteria bacterium]|nr:type VI secretion system tip protein VgrG [Deltaproteobacteria bacterium]
MAEQFETIDVSLSIDGTDYVLIQCTMHEAVSEVGSLICELTQGGGVPEPSGLLGKEATLSIKLRNSSVAREYNGIIVEAVRCADDDGRPLVRTRVAPRLWRTTKRTNCRIFQEKTTQEIVEEVLGEAGVPSSDQQWSLSGSYEPRIYCCQYRETDYEFVSRLLFEEGIIFAVVHEDGVDKVMFTDDETGLGDVEPNQVPFVTLQGFDSHRPQAMWLRQSQSVRTDKVSYRDYDFERPKYQLETEVEGIDDGTKSLEIYVYPGRFVDEGAGERYAQALLDSIQAERDVLSGEVTLLTMKPGHRLTIEQHPYEAFNQEWMVVSIASRAHTTVSFTDESGGGRDFVCRFTAVPTATTAYKAPRRAVTSDVPGMQTAFTTGPGGSEIHPDEYGRVKARFFWDRTDPADDTSSCWIRTEQPNTPDSMMLPRVGWEVQVRHLEGDVDRPVCLGRMFNALAPPPYSLPGGKARSAMQTNTSPGDGSSNELRTDDSAGSEEMFVNASKDLTMNVGNNQTMSIGNNETRDVGSNHSLAVTNSVHNTVGSNQTVDIGANQNVTVETFMVDEIGGDHSLSIGGNHDLKVGGDHKHTITGDSKQDVGANETDIVVGAVEEKVTGSFTHDVGAALVELTTGNRDFTVGGNRTETVGAVKVVGTVGGRGVEIGGNLTTMVAGAIVHKVKGDKSDKSGGPFTDLVAGAQIIKAKNVTFEGKDLVAVVMGASTLIVSKPAVLLAGTSVKWDGATKDTAALIVDN